MSVLYLDKKTVRLARDGRAVAVYDDEKRLTTVPLRMLERIVIYGSVALDSSLLYYLAMEGISVLMLGRGKNKIALVQGVLGKDASRRSLQYRLQQNADWCVAWSKLLIRHKLLSQQKLLSKGLRRRPDVRKDLFRSFRQLQTMQHGLKSGAYTAEQMLGLEGAAARCYFSALVRLFPASLNFSGRNRRPPRDPVNACLSLGYTLLHGEAVVSCYARGLDPYIGFYHTMSHGRESLASDLIEPLRTRVDLLVWKLFRRKKLRIEHFYTDNGGCFLNKTGRSIFYRSWEYQAPLLRRYLRRYIGLTVQQMFVMGSDQ